MTVKRTCKVHRELKKNVARYINELSCFFPRIILSWYYTPKLPVLKMFLMNNL